jgi:hypothetical protein
VTPKEFESCTKGNRNYGRAAGYHGIKIVEQEIETFEKQGMHEISRGALSMTKTVVEDEEIACWGWIQHQRDGVDSLVKSGP